MNLGNKDIFLINVNPQGRELVAGWVEIRQYPYESKVVNPHSPTESYDIEVKALPLDTPSFNVRFKLC